MSKSEKGTVALLFYETFKVAYCFCIIFLRLYASLRPEWPQNNGDGYCYRRCLQKSLLLVENCGGTSRQAAVCQRNGLGCCRHLQG